MAGLPQIRADCGNQQVQHPKAIRTARIIRPRRHTPFPAPLLRPSRSTSRAAVKTPMTRPTAPWWS